MRARTTTEWVFATAVILLLVALFVPGAAKGQSVSSGGDGGGSSFGRISGGGGSYGHLTHGFTARRQSARVPINPLTMANGTANTVRRGRTKLVPINPLTIADGTANTLQRRPEKPDDRRRRGRFRANARPFLNYVFPTRVVAIPYPVEVGKEEEPRRRLGRVPTPAEPAATPDREDGQGSGSVGGTSPEAGAATETTAAPRVKPPVPAAEGVGSLPPEACAQVRITTAGGIQWRQRIPLADYGASTPEEAAVELQEVLKRGDPLSLNGPDGSLTVPASLIRSFIVGPCRGF